MYVIACMLACSIHLCKQNVCKGYYKYGYNTDLRPLLDLPAGQCCVFINFHVIDTSVVVLCST